MPQELRIPSQDLASAYAAYGFEFQIRKAKHNESTRCNDLRCADLQAETNLADAAMRMWRGDCGALPVIADGQKVVGMITDRDICMAAATKHRDPANIRVNEVISGKVYSCSPDAEIHEALKIMQQKQVRRLPIIDAVSGKLAGILSMNDVALKAQGGRKAELTPEDMEQTLRSICAHHELPLAKQTESALQVAVG